MAQRRTYTLTYDDFPRNFRVFRIPECKTLFGGALKMRDGQPIEVGQRLLKKQSVNFICKDMGVTHRFVENVRRLVIPQKEEWNMPLGD